MPLSVISQHVPAATKLGACFTARASACQTLHFITPTLPEQRTQSDYECCCSRKGGAGVDAASSADRSCDPFKDHGRQPALDSGPP